MRAEPVQQQRRILRPPLPAVPRPVPPHAQHQPDQQARQDRQELGAHPALVNVLTPPGYPPRSSRRNAPASQISYSSDDQPRTRTRRRHTSGWFNAHSTSAALPGSRPGRSAPSSANVARDRIQQLPELRLDPVPERGDVVVAGRCVADHHHQRPGPVLHRPRLPGHPVEPDAGVRFREQVPEPGPLAHRHVVRVAAQQHVPQGPQEPALRRERDVHRLQGDARPVGDGRHRGGGVAVALQQALGRAQDLGARRLRLRAPARRVVATRGLDIARGHSDTLAHDSLHVTSIEVGGSDVGARAGPRHVVVGGAGVARPRRRRGRTGRGARGAHARAGRPRGGRPGAGARLRPRGARHRRRAAGRRRGRGDAVGRVRGDARHRRRAGGGGGPRERPPPQSSTSRRSTSRTAPSTSSCAARA